MSIKKIIKTMRQVLMVMSIGNVFMSFHANDILNFCGVIKKKFMCCNTGYARLYNTGYARREKT